MMTHARANVRRPVAMYSIVGSWEDRYACKAARHRAGVRDAS